LESQEIRPSVVDLPNFEFGNQVVERLFGTLKGLLRAENASYESITSSSEMTSLVETVVSRYNSNGHKSLLGLNPVGMEDALTLFNPTAPEVEDTGLGLSERFSAKGDESERLKSLVVQNYAGNWLNFFMEWRVSFVQEVKEEMRKENRLQTDELIEHYEANTRKLKEHHSAEMALLRETLALMQKALTSLEMRALEAEAHSKMLEERKKRRQERVRLPSRDAAGLRELKLAISVVKSKECVSAFTSCRDIVCLSILFLTGLRVSNLLSLQVQHIIQLLEDHKFDLALIKSRKSIVQTFYLPSSSLSYFEEIKPYFSALIEGKSDSSYLITEEKGTTPLQDKALIQRLNLILKEVSKQCHKNIKTHSFRINLTTALIETVGIELASKAIGHSDIRTTEMYNRRALGFKELSTIYDKAHKHISTLDRQKEVRRETRAKRKLISKGTRKLKPEND
jgi:site-specific recombinase XerD